MHQRLFCITCEHLTPIQLVFVQWQVSAGGSHTCAVSSAGKLWCWGYGPATGLDTGADILSPLVDVFAGSGEKALKVAAGSDTACALMECGRVKCWGLNGGMGLGAPDDTRKPTEYVPLSGVVDIRTGYGYHMCALGRGQLYCWVIANFLSYCFRRI